MTNDVESKRAYLCGLYGSSRRWKRQVAKMPDSQVIAIYLKEISKPKPEPKPPHKNEDEIPF